MKKTDVVVKQSVIPNLIWNLQRLSLSFLNSVRGRSRIKYGMTPLFNNGGFTLIELLVVVLIIGILAAVAVPQYRVAVAKSRYAKLKHMVRALVEAEEVYYLANSAYTINMEDLDVEIPNGTLDTEKSTNEKNRYVYDWGYCVLINEEKEKRAQCVDNEVSMGYREYYIHTVKKSGKRYCEVRDTTDETDWRTAICKAETNNGKYSKNTTYNFLGWTY